MPSVYDFSAKLANGDETSLADFKGQVLLVVNTASKCGFTPQYEGLETLYAQHKDAGFSVLAFPCNQFGAQAPCSSSCERAYMYHKVGLPDPTPSLTIFDKVDVNGPEQPETYAVLKGGATAGHDAGFDVSSPPPLSLPRPLASSLPRPGPPARSH